MSLTKRGKTWHTHFFVDGQRFRQSLETSDWREAQAKEKDLIADAKAGKLSPTRQEFARLPFREAAERFLQDRIPQLAALSVRTERERAKVLNKKLGDVQVSRFTTETVLLHVRERKAAGIANATINRELDIIRGVLKKAKLWHRFADEIKPLPLRQSVGRALSYEGKLKLVKTAALRPEWQNAAWAATLALNTTMRGCEIKQLRWQDIDLMEKALTIRKSKTEAGERVIPLNSDAWNTILLLYARAKRLGEVRPEHYVFPACEASHFDPMRPQTSWRTAWRNLTRLIQCPACAKQQGPSEACENEKCMADLKKVKSPLAGLRFHDLRHHAITELAESQASDSTVMAIAGHVSSKMLAHYSHVRIQAKRTALDSLSTKQAERASSGSETKGYDTKHDTKRDAAEIVPPQLIENLVELVGIEPTTSSLRTMRSPS
jgi:integrase